MNAAERVARVLWNVSKEGRDPFFTTYFLDTVNLLIHSPMNFYRLVSVGFDIFAFV